MSDATSQRPDASQSPPVTDMRPLVNGCHPPPGVFTLVELEAVPVGERQWRMHASWELTADTAGPLVVDGIVMTMEDADYALQVEPTEVAPGGLYRTKGPTIGWRPEVMRAEREAGEQTPSDKTVGPFTAGQVASINAYQLSGVWHPFTCEHRGADGHIERVGEPGHGILIATQEWLICRDCGYTQRWVHSWMADGSWRAMADRQGSDGE